MADGATTADGRVETGSGNRGLIYPLGEPPAPGQAVQAAPGVLWMRLAMPMALDHINVYAIADGASDILKRGRRWRGFDPKEAEKKDDSSLFDFFGLNTG